MVDKEIVAGVESIPLDPREEGRDGVFGHWADGGDTPIGKSWCADGAWRDEGSRNPRGRSRHGGPRWLTTSSQRRR